MKRTLLCCLLTLTVVFGAGSLLQPVQASLGVLCGVGCQVDRDQCVDDCEDTMCYGRCRAGFEYCWLECGLPITVLP